MSAGAQIDYAALAKQAGAINSQPAGSIDYAALAKQAGAVSSQPATASMYQRLTQPDQTTANPVARFFSNVGGAVIGAPGAALSAIAHPIDTIKGMGNSVNNAIDAYANPATRPSWEGIKSVLPEALGMATGNVAAGEATGAALPEMVRKVSPAASDLLKSSAQKNYEDVLNPTKVSTKYQTQKIMPQLLEERPVAMTRQGLAGKAAGQAEQAGQQIEQTVSGLQGKINTQPVIDGLQNLKKSYQVNGVSLRPEVDNAIDAVSEQMQQMGPDISLQDAVKARRILDNAVAEAKGYQGAQLSDASMAAIRKETANSIRSELGQASPDLAALNSKFHFWNTLSDVLDQTIQRKTGQVNALPKVETAIAGAGGLAKAGLSGATGAGTAMWLLGKTIRSTAWRTVSAATKSSIADALAGGKFDDAVGLLGKTGIVGQALSGEQDQGAADQTSQGNQVPIASLLNYDPVEARAAFKNPIVQHALNTLNPGAANSVIRKYGVADTRKYFKGRNV